MIGAPTRAWAVARLGVVLAVCGPLVGACAHGYTRWSPDGASLCIAEDPITHGPALVFHDPKQKQCSFPSNREMIVAHCEPQDDKQAAQLTSADQANVFRECAKVRGTFGTYRGLHIRAANVAVSRGPEDGPQDEQQMFGPDLLSGAAPAAATERNARRGFGEDLEALSLVNGQRLSVMYQKEFDSLKSAKSSAYARYTGLALSGGGVRSAAFATGALISLHDMDLLENLGYLSTVSGGGFAGAWFMVHRSIPNDTLFRPGGRDLHHLSQFGSYLTSRNASQSTSGLVATFAVHVGLLPVQWFVNGVFDWNVNVPYLRTSYRHGIAAAFEYKSALAPGDAADDGHRLGSMAAYPPDATHPVWIINMHLALNDDNGFYKARTGDAVELTPFRAGGDAAGYIEVPNEACWTCDTFWTAPYFAVAASGAALDGNSGYQGALASFGLWVVNLNLGYHVPSWSEEFVGSGATWRTIWYYAMSPFPLHLWSDYHRQRATSKSFLLTDGGHFDNLGLYALIRRGLRFIVVVDGAQDDRINQWCNAHAAGDYSALAAAFDDLHVTEEKLYSDFGVKITWQWDEICSKPTAGFRDWVPSHVFTGRIRGLPVRGAPDSNDDTTAAHDVFIVYVKAAYSNDDGILKTSSFIDANKIADPAFPNNSTGDQFFTERQILSYRELGRRSLEPGSQGSSAIQIGIHKLCAEIAPTAVTTCEQSFFQPRK